MTQPTAQRPNAQSHQEQVLAALRWITPLGWSVIVFSVFCWVLGAKLDWVEFLMIAAAGIALVVLGLLMTIGRANLRVKVEVNPQRVVVGNAGGGRVQVTNMARGLRVPLALELPVGSDVARFLLPAMRPGSQHEELFVVPTNRRGVIDVGPATTVRGDPLGIARRAVEWGRPLELFVHPRTAALEPLGAGLLRDLEGVTTNAVSMTDLAFHTLREYQPGDDRRYIHWRSSAKAGTFLVRQFLDTRRSHILVIVDSDPASYRDEEEYELAMSAGASVAVRAVLDEQTVSVVAGEQSVPDAQGQRVLDTFSRAELTGEGLSDLAARAARVAPDVSIALMVTGHAVPFAELMHAANNFAPEVNTVALRIDPQAVTGISGSTALTVLSLRVLAELPPLLHGALT